MGHLYWQENNSPGVLVSGKCMKLCCTPGLRCPEVSQTSHQVQGATSSSVLNICRKCGRGAWEGKSISGSFGAHLEEIRSLVAFLLAPNY